jgi:carbamoyltransferase
LIRRRRSEQLLEFFQTHCFPYAHGLTPDIMSYARFAASVQASLEEALFELARHLRTRTGSTNLVLSGGVALNCTANGRLVHEAGFQTVYIQPMAGDSGVVLGAAIAAQAARHGPASVDARMEHSYYGPVYGPDEIASALGATGLDHRQLSEAALVEQVAALWPTVGWSAGFKAGPRSDRALSAPGLCSAIHDGGLPSCASTRSRDARCGGRSHPVFCCATGTSTSRTPDPTRS